MNVCEALYCVKQGKIVTRKSWPEGCYMEQRAGKIEFFVGKNALNNDDLNAYDWIVLEKQRSAR